LPRSARSATGGFCDYDNRYGHCVKWSDGVRFLTVWRELLDDLNLSSKGAEKMQTLWLLLALAPLVTQSTTAEPSSQPHDLNVDGVTALLTTMDVVASLHPDFANREERLALLPTAERQAALEEARSRNEESQDLAAAIQTLINTETYRLYFRRYPNVSAADLREIILDLPYLARSAPGGIGDTYYELLRHRDDARAAVRRLLHDIDLDWVYETARRWSPEGAVEPPTIFLIYDSNAGSYTAEGKPFFNVYSSGTLDSLLVVLGNRPLLAAQGTMAHELQHLMAEPVLYPEETGEEADDRSWQAVWLDRITRGLVGEGVANHCNPPVGIKRDVYEDTVVVAALVGRLNQMLTALEQGGTTEDDMRAWYRANYFEAAEALLRAHFEGSYEGQKLEAMINEHMHVRPDLEHALGWWMTSRISRNGAEPGRAVALLDDPFSVYQLYNETVPNDRPELRISPASIRYFQTLGDQSMRRSPTHRSVGA